MHDWARGMTRFIYTHAAHDTVHAYLIKSRPSWYDCRISLFYDCHNTFCVDISFNRTSKYESVQTTSPHFWVKSVPLHPVLLFIDDVVCWSVWWLNCTSWQFWMITVCNWVINIYSSFFTCSTFSHQPFVLESHCSPPTKLRFPGALRTVTAGA